MRLPLSYKGEKQLLLPASLFPQFNVPTGCYLSNEHNENCFQAQGHIWAQNEKGQLVPGIIFEKIAACHPEEELHVKKDGFSLAIITLSDKGSAGKRVDESGPLILEMLKPALNPCLERRYLLPDDAAALKGLLSHLAYLDCLDLVITTGGTGVSERDITPRVTASLLDIPLPGFVNAMLMTSLAKTPNAVISRAAAGIIRKTLVINLPGSKKAARENLEAVLPALVHALKKIGGDDSDCGAAG